MDNTSRVKMKSLRTLVLGTYAEQIQRECRDKGCVVVSQHTWI